jgi:hypothetical protein
VEFSSLAEYCPFTAFAVYLRVPAMFPFTREALLLVLAASRQENVRFVIMVHEQQPEKAISSERDNSLEIAIEKWFGKHQKAI